MSSTSDAGPTYLFVVAAYVSVALVGAGAVALSLRDVSVRTGAVAVLLGGIGVLALVGSLVGLRGVPGPLHPRRLYTSGASFLPAALGALVVAAAVAALAADLAPAGALLLAAVAGVGLGIVGGVLRVMARNADARAYLDAPIRAEWEARPAVGRRRAYYLASGVLTLGLLAVIVLERAPSLLGVLGATISLAAQGSNRRRCRLTDDVLVYGNVQSVVALDRDAIRDATLDDGALRLDRAGWKPSLTFDAGDIESPADVLAAFER